MIDLVGAHCAFETFYCRHCHIFVVSDLVNFTSPFGSTIGQPRAKMFEALGLVKGWGCVWSVDAYRSQYQSWAGWHLATEKPHMGPQE
jgi:hypothetical protein